MKDHPDEEVAWAGILGPLRLADVLYAAAKAQGVGPLQVVRADRVMGEAHLRSAALHARRALREGRAAAERPEVEFTRYLAGERQIRKALDWMGLPESCEAAVAVALGPKRRDTLAYFLHVLAAKEDDGVAETTAAKMAGWGFTAAALEATTPERRGDLVLERVARVDVL